MYKNFSIGEEIITEVYFRLNILKNRSFIEIVNKKGVVCENLVNPAQSDKNTLKILTLIEEIYQNAFFNISWENRSNYIYLDENLEIFHLLIKSKYFVSENFDKFEIKKTQSELTLSIDNIEDFFQLQFFLDEKYTKFTFLTSDYVLRENKIYHIQNMGDNYLKILDLNIKTRSEDIESVLTIVINYFNNLKIKYKDYKVEKLKKKIIPQIIIEKISQDKSLYLRFKLENTILTYKMIKDCELKIAIKLNYVENKIYIYDIDIYTFYNPMKYLTAILLKHQKKLKLKNSYYIEDNLIILNEQLAKEFIKEDLLNLSSKYKFIGIENLKKYKIKNVQPKLRVKSMHNIDFLEGDFYLEIGNENFSILDIISTYNKDSYIQLSDDTHALISKKYIEKLERIFKSTESSNNSKISFFDLPIIEELIGQKIKFDNHKYPRKIFDDLNEIQQLDIPAPIINATVRTYQLYGYKWLYYITENRLGGCLADDMGLGKTIQAICILAFTYLYKKIKTPSLIIMPKSLIFNWESEIKKFCNNLSTSIYCGHKRDFSSIKNTNIILTTYGTVRNDIQLLRNKKFEIIILDESQNIKNIASQTTKAVMLLNSEKRLALSGTPIENNLSELYSLFRFLNPKMFGSIDNFNNNYINTIKKNGNDEVFKELKKKIYPFILRRVKQQVLKDLPDKIEKTLYVEMNSAQKKMYQERRVFYKTILDKKLKQNGIIKNKIFILQALNELRQIASCPESKSNNLVKSAKLEVLIEHILEAVVNGHKVLVFTNYINSVENICQKLKQNVIEHIFMMGSTKNRQELVNKFQSDKKCKVFVMTLKTGGVGLNLTAADTIFIYDPWWNKTVENQAVDRSHRMGQDRTVFSYKLITKGTIEEKMLLLQIEKNKLFNNLITTDSLNIKSLNKSEITYMLGE